MMKNGLHNVSHSYSPEDEAFPPLPPPHSPGRAGPDHRDPFGNEDEEEEGNVSTLVDVPTVKRRGVKRPQPKLDSNRLISERGLPALRSLFDDVRFKGKGHEASDLRLLMQKMENWAHRLFPKLQFEDFVDKVEKLGNKKEVQTCLKRIRLDMPLTHEDFMGKEGEEEAAPEPQKFEDPDLFSGSGFSQGPVHSTPAPPAPSAPSPAAPSLTEEQRRRMEENRRRALERKLARHQQQKDASDYQTPADEHTSVCSSNILHKSEEEEGKQEEQEKEKDGGLDPQPADSSSSSHPVSQSPHKHSEASAEPSQEEEEEEEEESSLSPEHQSASGVTTEIKAEAQHTSRV